MFYTADLELHIPVRRCVVNIFFGFFFLSFLLTSFAAVFFVQHKLHLREEKKTEKKRKEKNQIQQIIDYFSTRIY